MKKIMAIMLIVTAIGAGCAGGAGGGGLGSNSISDQQGNSIHTGMSPTQVQGILGKPESISKSTIDLGAALGGAQHDVDYTYSGSNDSTWVFSFTNGSLNAKSQL